MLRFRACEEEEEEEGGGERDWMKNLGLGSSSRNSMEAPRRALCLWFDSRREREKWRERWEG